MVAIVGTGAMAETLVQGFVKKGLKPEVIGRNEDRLDFFAKTFHTPTILLQKHPSIENKELVLAIKPHALEAVAKQLQGKAKTLYSILAATPIERLKKNIKATAFIRAMPNIAAKNLASTTALTGDESSKEEAIELFSAIGKTIWLENERKLDIATAIAGSGPAFLAIIAEAMADGGVACGLTRSEAQKLVAGLFESYASLANEHPALLKDAVASPAGTTIAGLRKLEEKGARSAFIEAIVAAFERTES